MKETITNSNRASIGGHIVEKGVANLLEGIRFVCSIVFFNVGCVFHGIGPELFVSAITQDLVLLSGAQFVICDVIKNVVNNNAIKLIGNFKGVIKTSTIVNVN